jgi:hypothetical protein
MAAITWNCFGIFKRNAAIHSSWKCSRLRAVCPASRRKSDHIRREPVQDDLIHADPVHADSVHDFREPRSVDMVGAASSSIGPDVSKKEVGR